MYKGSLRASGTSASLKHQHGDGYTVKLPHLTDFEVQLPGKAIKKEQSRHQTVYRVPTAELAVQIVEQLEAKNFAGYQISGPTMEDLFLKVTGDTILEPKGSSDDEKSIEKQPNEKKDLVTINIAADSDYGLTEGQPISASKQWWILFCKRFRILKRRYIPYVVAVSFAIVGAGVAQLLIKKITKPLQCPTLTPIDDYDYYGYNFGSEFISGYTPLYAAEYPQAKYKYVFGPASKLNETKFDLVANTYSTNNIYNNSPDYPRGYNNASQIIEQCYMVNTYEEFTQAIQTSQNLIEKLLPAEVAAYLGTTLQGGFWVGDATSKPTILGNIDEVYDFTQMINVLDILTTGVRIASSYSNFPPTFLPDLIDFVALPFIIYFGLIMCWYVVL